MERLFEMHSNRIKNSKAYPSNFISIFISIINIDFTKEN